MTLEIIGDGPQLAELKARVAQENLGGKVDFPGWVAHAEVRRHLSSAQIFAFPSVREFGGGVVLEAMALGLAPVVIDYGGPAELIPQDCGTLVPMGNRDAIIRAFHRVLTVLTADPAAVHATGLRAQRHVRAHFTWAAKARQLLQIYAWALQGTPAPKPDLWVEEKGGQSAAGGAPRMSDNNIHLECR